MMPPLKRKNLPTFFFFLCILHMVHSFAPTFTSLQLQKHNTFSERFIRPTIRPLEQRTNRDTLDRSTLFAKKKKSGRAARNKIGNRTASASGFGGAATEECPCGSGLGYMKCCGKIHKSPDAYAAATAEQVVRARYSAYAKREVDFIVGSTHPLNENFMADIEHWKKTIRENCYDNFELKECKIISETYEGEDKNEVATVKFIAKMIQVDSREKTSFMETSTFERAGKHIRGGAWLYRSGVVETPSTEILEGKDEKTVEAS